MKLASFFFILLFFFISNLTYSATPGFYAGVGAGYGSLDEIDGTSQENNGGLGAAVFVGYNFDKYVGLEAGYRQYPIITYRINYYDWIKFNYNLQTVFLVLKAYIPSDENNPFNFYGLLGYARNFASAQVANYSGSSTTNQSGAVTGGLGILYKISPQLSGAIESSITSGKEGFENRIDIPQSYLTTVNFVYYFS